MSKISRGSKISNVTKLIISVKKNHQNLVPIIQYFYRIYLISATVPYRYFAKIPLHLNVTLFTHRDMQRYIEKYAVTSIVTLNCNGKGNGNNGNGNGRCNDVTIRDLTTQSQVPKAFLC